MLSYWDNQVASNIARECGITLTSRHVEIINILRDLYCAQHRHPSTRTFIKALRDGQHAETMLELMQLFGEKPLRVISHIAGLPQPPHCI